MRDHTMNPQIECVPNFSEGRSRAVISGIRRAILSADEVLLLDQTMDADHNRSVFTLAGSPGGIVQAVLRAGEVAVDAIDLRAQRGVHPRIGALDVVPLVPLEGMTSEELVALARQLGQRIWDELEVPVYYYGDAAVVEHRRRLENVRRGGFEGLLKCLPDAQERWPDVGGPGLHPTAGACAIGVRKFLIAYNIELTTPDVSIAKRIAGEIRESAGGLASVKALGLKLSSRNTAQVSMNLTDYERTPPHQVFETVRDRAKELGASVAGAELIGLIPRAALAGAPAEFAATFSADQILENRIDSVRGGEPIEH